MVWKGSTVAPVAKEASLWSFNDYGSVSHISLLMKTFELVVKNKILATDTGQTGPQPDC